MGLSDVSSQSPGVTRLFGQTLTGAVSAIDTGATIPGGFSILQIVFCGATSGSGTDVGANVTLNGDTGAHYDQELIRGTNTTVSANIAQATSSWSLDVTGTNTADSYSSTVVLWIPAYSGTTFWKSCSGTEALPYSQSQAQNVFTQAYGWRSTAAINRVAVTAATGNLVAGSSLFLYGYP